MKNRSGILREDINRVRLILESSKLLVSELLAALKDAGYRIDDKESTSRAIKYWAKDGDFKKLISIMKLHGGRYYPANPSAMSPETISGPNFEIKLKTASSIYCAILKSAGKELRGAGIDY